MQLSRVALVSAPGIYWEPDEATRFMDVRMGDPAGELIGEIHIDYHYNEQYARPHSYLDIRRQGIGTEIYTAIPFIPLPGGEDFKEAGFKFRTYRHSDQANKLWESLARKGFARRLFGNQVYEMLDTLPSPARLEITEIGMLPKLPVEV